MDYSGLRPITCGTRVQGFLTHKLALALGTKLGTVTESKHSYRNVSRVSGGMCIMTQDLTLVDPLH